MRLAILTLALLAASTSTATAQTIVFQDGFENGFAQWTASGFWNSVDVTNSCLAPAIPFAEGTGAAWYGQQSTCNFDTGAVANSGGLELNTWITLPTNVASVTLYYQSWSHDEYCYGPGDIHRLLVFAQGGPDAGFTEYLCPAPSSGIPLLPWHVRRTDLTAYRGAQVRIRFDFNSNDFWYNTTLGWLVDDVRIVAEPGSTFCPPASAFSECPCNNYYRIWGGGCPQSNGASATLMSGGLASVAGDTLTFTAAHMPAGTTALLFQGTTPQTPLTWLGDGRLCVGGGLLRMGTAITPSGTQAWPLVSTPPLSATGAVPAIGGDRYYQVFFRDSVPFCLPATFNLTSAQKVTWMP